MGNWTIHELGRLLADATHEDRREDRTHNTANEIASWTGLVTPPGASGSVGVGYDAAGDLTTHGQIDDPDLKLYAYDADGSLSRISRLVADPQGGTILPIAEYVHDALGRRVRKKVWPAEGGDPTEQSWLWSPGWQLLEVRRIEPGQGESGPTETLETEFIHAGPTAYVDDHVALIDHDAGTSGESTYFIHADHMACSLALSDAGGAVVERYVIDPYGQPVVYDGDWTNPRNASSYGNLFLHQGLPFDAESGTYYNRNRQYHPGIGRFLQRDPMGYIDGANSYAYVGGDPLGWVDPLGLILRDKNGKIIKIKVGDPVGGTHDDGSKAKYQPVKIICDDRKTIITGFDMLSGGDEGMDTNCHGRTFADAEIWIQDDDAGAILEGDGYRKLGKGEKAQKGDVVIYRQKGKIVHSVTVDEVDEKTGEIRWVIGEGGTQIGPHRTPPGPGDGTAWKDKDAKRETWRKPKPKPSKPNDKNEPKDGPPSKAGPSSSGPSIPGGPGSSPVRR